jgi:heme exporter protein D
VEAISTFFAMGGYAGFVWSAFGVTALVMAGLWVASWRSLKAREAELAALPPLPERAERRRRGTGPAATVEQ